MRDFIKKHESIQTKQDFIEFLELLVMDLRQNPAGWENNNLENYLDAAKNWTEDNDQYYINMNLPVPKDMNWKAFADILIAATMYE